MVGCRVSWSSANKHGVVKSYSGVILLVRSTPANFGWPARTQYLIRLDNGFVQFMDDFIVSVE